MRVYSSLGSAPCCMGFGQERTLEQAFTPTTLTREELVASREERAAAAAKEGFPWWGYLGIGLGVVAVGGLLYAVFK